MQAKVIHQFHPACSSGDGVSNGMLFTRRLLKKLGFESEIYCDHIPADMANEVRPRRELELHKDDLLLVHHSLGYENCGWLSTLACRKVIVYHNITPAHLLPEAGELRRLSMLGREQLKQWMPDFIAGIGDSEVNSAELREAGYANVSCIPLLVDTNLVRHTPHDMAAVASLRNAINLLFVGRVCENKRQLDLIEVLHELMHFSTQPVRLILAGGVSSGEYLDRIRSRIDQLGLQDQVLLLGKVPESTLSALYRTADAFVSTSEHEGFGMPLIEAMLFDVPVVARASSSIPDTMGTGGLILDNDSAREMAAALHLLLSEPGLRRRVIEGQRRNLERFAPDHLIQQLADFLMALGIQVPQTPLSASREEREPYWQVEGPFDSTYSLAIVNRETARALAARDHHVGLRSMEGGGDFTPSPSFLQMNPDCAQLSRHATQAKRGPDVSLRFCYPPQVDDMAGVVRGMHSYGWEESSFPADYVAAFNRRLDFVSVLSGFVEKVLRDNGVRIPIAVTGGGVDHLQAVAPQAPELNARSFRFLHVSSCFPRKGVDVLLRAYGRAFRDQDDVSLVIKTFPNPHNDIAEQLEKLRRRDPGYPHVVLINRDFSDAELVGLYQACNAFVAPSRGEGLGLPMAEAMMFNLPVITTGWGGQRDFCNDSTAWLCDYRFAKAQTHLSASHSVWAEPDENHLSALLQEVKNASDAERAARTTTARALVLKEFTWKRVAERMEQAVESVGKMPVYRDEPKIAWISSWNTRCGIAAYSSFLTCAIPSQRLVVLPNRTAERTAQDLANVARSWNMSYDENLDDVFDAIVAQGVGAVVIQYNFGFFSLAAFARLIERLCDARIAVHCFFHATADLVREGKTISLSQITSSLARADRLYVHGVQDLNRFKDFGLVDNVVLFPQGLLPTPTGTGEAERQRLGLVGKTVLAAYGFLLPHKGIQHLIRAFAGLAAQDANLHLLLVTALYPIGDSANEKKACEALINKLGLQQKVTFITDFLEDQQCLALLRTADLIVYPYQETQESSSAAVRMGLAAGRPVAVTPLQIFDDAGDAVHRLPGTDADALEKGIRAFMQQPEAMKQQAQKAELWTAPRQWPLLSVRLLNLIDGMANPLSPDARHI
jgi:glycosyltransferase involved in cell wall biosynthesis